MNTFILLLLTVSFFLQNIVFSFESNQYKSCQTCKWFIPNEQSSDYGLCRLFKERLYIVDKERLICNFAKYCRNNELLCGKEGNLYEDNLQTFAEFNIEKRLSDFDKTYEKLIESIDDTSNVGHGEIIENNELYNLNQLDKDVEKFTKEGLDLLFKVQKFNKRKISVVLDNLCKNNNKYFKKY
jgi:hypothetical protein